MLSIHCGQSETPIAARPEAKNVRKALATYGEYFVKGPVKLAAQAHQKVNPPVYPGGQAALPRC